MVKTLLLGFTLLLGSTDWETIIKPIYRQVPRIEILTAGARNPSTCSGVVINTNPGYVLTAAHCLRGDVVAVTVNGRHAVVVVTNPLIEQAILKFTPKDEVAITLATESPGAGKEVAAAGFDFGDEDLAVQFGHISQKFNRATKTMWVDAEIIPGQSGGAIIDIKGRLVGLTSSIYYSGPSSIGAVVPIEQILDFVAPYLPKPTQTAKK